MSATTAAGRSEACPRTWAWATGGRKRPLDSAVPPDAVPNAGLGADVQINYSKFTFLLGFVFGT